MDEILLNFNELFEGEKNIEKYIKAIESLDIAIEKLKENGKQLDKIFTENGSGKMAIELQKTTNEIKRLNAEIENGTNKRTQAEKDLEKQLRAQESAVKSLDAQRQKAYQQMLKDEQKEQAHIKALKEEAKTMDELKAKLSAMIKERNKMSISSDEFKKSTVEIGKVNAKLKELDGQIGNFQRNVGNYAGGIKTAFMDMVNPTTLAMGAVYGLGVAFNDAIENIKKFQTSANELRAVTGLAGKDFQFLENQSISLSSKLGKSATEILDAFKLVGSAKPELLQNAEALAAMTEKAIIFSQAGGAAYGLEQAVSDLTVIMNGFNAGAGETDRYMNTLAAAAQKGTKEVPYLAEAMSKTAGTAQTLNVGLEQSAAALELIGAKTPEAGTAGTQYRNILLKLAADQKNMTNGTFDYNKALTNLAAKQNDITGLTKEFGAENVNAAIILAQSQKQLTEFAGAITNTSTAYDMAKENMQGLAFEQDKARIAYENMILSMDKGQGVLSSVSTWWYGLKTKIWESLTPMKEFADANDALNKSMEANMNKTPWYTKVWNVAKGFGTMGGSTVTDALFNRDKKTTPEQQKEMTAFVSDYESKLRLLGVGTKEFTAYYGAMQREMAKKFDLTDQQAQAVMLQSYNKLAREKKEVTTANTEATEKETTAITDNTKEKKKVFDIEKARIDTLTGMEQKYAQLMYDFKKELEDYDIKLFNAKGERTQESLLLETKYQNRLYEIALEGRSKIAKLDEKSRFDLDNARVTSGQTQGLVTSYMGKKVGNLNVPNQKLSKLNKPETGIEKAANWLGENQEEIDTGKQVITSIMDGYNALLQADITRTEKEIENSNKRIEAKQKEIDELEALKKEGKAYDAVKLESAKKEVEAEKEKQKQLEAEKVKAQNKQIAMDKIQIAMSIAQTGADLISGVAKIIKAHSGIPFVGVLLAATQIAAMFAMFAKFKSLTKQSVPKFAQGTDSVQLNGNPKGVDTVPAYVNEGEMIVPTNVVKQMGGISRFELPKAVQAYHILNNMPKEDGTAKLMLSEQQRTNQILSKDKPVTEIYGKTIVKYSNGIRYVYHK